MSRAASDYKSSIRCEGFLGLPIHTSYYTDTRLIQHQTPTYITPRHEIFIYIYIYIYIYIFCICLQIFHIISCIQNKMFYFGQIHINTFFPAGRWPATGPRGPPPVFHRSSHNFAWCYTYSVCCTYLFSFFLLCWSHVFTNIAHMFACMYIYIYIYMCVCLDMFCICLQIFYIRLHIFRIYDIYIYIYT